jgi:hypothetical protein
VSDPFSNLSRDHVTRTRVLYLVKVLSMSPFFYQVYAPVETTQVRLGHATTIIVAL